MRTRKSYKQNNKLNQGLEWYCNVLVNGKKCGKVSNYLVQRKNFYCNYHWDIYLGFQKELNVKGN